MVIGPKTVKLVNFNENTMKQKKKKNSMYVDHTVKYLKDYSDAYEEFLSLNEVTNILNPFSIYMTHIARYPKAIEEYNGKAIMKS